MHQKISTGGFAELVILLAGLTGITIFSIVQTVPKAKAASVIMSEPSITATDSPVPTTPTSIPLPEVVQAEIATGVNITADLQLEVLLADKKFFISLLGAEAAASDSALCNTEDFHKTLVPLIRNKNLFLLNYEQNSSSSDSARYVFLKNELFINKYLISQGFARAKNVAHPYYDEFMHEQAEAQKNQQGMWSDSCHVTPTALPSPLPSPTNEPTLTNTPTRTSAATPTPSPTISLKDYLASSNSATLAQPSLDSDLILQLINLHRKTKNLPPFEKHPELCKLAQARAPELYNEIFGDGYIHEGFYKRNIPYWITENMASYSSEDANVNWWLNSTVHRTAIEGNYKYSCGACSGNSCTQLFTSYLSK